MAERDEYLAGLTPFIDLLERALREVRDQRSR